MVRSYPDVLVFRGMLAIQCARSWTGNRISAYMPLILRSELFCYMPRILKSE